MNRSGFGRGGFLFFLPSEALEWLVGHFSGLVRGAMGEGVLTHYNYRVTIITVKTYDKVCETCGKAFTTSTYWQRFCSDACKMKAWRAAQPPKVKEPKPQPSK